MLGCKSANESPSPFNMQHNLWRQFIKNCLCFIYHTQLKLLSKVSESLKVYLDVLLNLKDWLS